jgi:magnesium-transporting ATPase (P-type)
MRGLLELAIDPTCALAFEGERSSRDAMKRPPRKPDDALFGPRQLLTAALQGVAILGSVLALYIYAVTNLTVEQARGAAFIALVVANLTLALVDAAGAEGRILDSERRIYWIIAGALMAMLAMVVASPWLAAIFHLAAPSLTTCSALALVSSAALGIGCGPRRIGEARETDTAKSWRGRNRHRIKHDRCRRHARPGGLRLVSGPETLRERNWAPFAVPEVDRCSSAHART